MEESIKTEQINVYQYSPLALAYMGDSILDLLVKKYFVTHSNMQPHKYHVEVSKIVKAVNQADYIDRVMEELSEIPPERYWTKLSVLPSVPSIISQTETVCACICLLSTART